MWWNLHANLAEGGNSLSIATPAFLELVSLERRRAGLILVWMFVGGLVAAVFIVTAWTGLMAALAVTDGTQSKEAA